MISGAAETMMTDDESRALGERAVGYEGRRVGLSVADLARWPHVFRFQPTRAERATPSDLGHAVKDRAESWLRALGFGLGISQAGAPRAIFPDDAIVPKWRNLSPEERRAAAGVIIPARGGLRGLGDLEVRLAEAPEGGGPSFEPIPIHEWGRDHRSTLLYAESRSVDAGGWLDPRRMRADPRRHASLFVAPSGATRGKVYPTRLASGEDLWHHDDWDCLEDLEAAGALSWVGGFEQRDSRIEMTDAGARLAADLRRARSERRAT